MSQSRNIKLTVAVLLGVILLFIAGFVYRVAGDRAPSVEELKADGFYLLETPRRFGELDLVDHEGRPFTRERLQGRWSLLFFGFTYCPDICPTTLADLDKFVASLEPSEVEDTQVAMVTVDPARDTAEQLARYVPYFNRSFTGVTGEFLDIHRFATALNIPFRKEAGAGEDYLVDHSANIVLINPRGDYHGFFRAPLDRADMLRAYRGVRARWHGSG